SPNQLVENVPALFGNSWAASPHCKNEENDIVVDPCHTNFQSRNFAHEGCSILTSTLFSACHLELDPAPFERQCRFEACAGADAERSLCSSVAHYAFLCQRAGISVNFRPKMPAKCDLRCDLKSGMEYQKCSSLCQRTCRDLGSPPAPCPSTCVEGCTCTEGTYLDSMRGGCVEAVCQNGLINCTEVSDPDCPSGEFLVSCSGEFQGLTEGSACEPSCGSPHIDRGSECRGGLFSCVSEGCPKVCAAVGHREFLQFDGQWKLELSEGGVEEGGLVVVSVRAVRCGSGESTFCSKVVSVEMDSGSLQLDDSEGHVTLHDVDESSFPEYHLHFRGILVLLELPSLGLSIYWDKHMAVYLSIAASLHGSVSGFCGNANDETADDSLMPSGIYSSDTQEYGNSWASSELCSRQDNVTNPCDVYPHRKYSAVKRCNILMDDVFSSCRNEVDPDELVSLESADHPNFFVRRSPEGLPGQQQQQLLLHKWRPGDAFLRDATFVLRRVRHRPHRRRHDGQDPDSDSVGTGESGGSRESDRGDSVGGYGEEEEVEEVEEVEEDGKHPWSRAGHVELRALGESGGVPTCRKTGERLVVEAAPLPGGRCCAHFSCQLPTTAPPYEPTEDQEPSEPPPHPTDEATELPTTAPPYEPTDHPEDNSETPPSPPPSSTSSSTSSPPTTMCGSAICPPAPRCVKAGERLVVVESSVMGDCCPVSYCSEF
ncbi:unnamed protein product, partial [Lampetra fluviatilis]